jgi:crotonobetainyl-CoA:carnitine CoA-transferase CaiB-like acyl-CoA transferase
VTLFSEQFRPGVMDRLKLGFQDLKNLILELSIARLQGMANMALFQRQTAYYLMTELKQRLTFF